MADPFAQGLLAGQSATAGGLLSPAPTPPLVAPIAKPKLFRGQLAAGNINLDKRPKVPMGNGEFATVLSMSFSPDGKHEFLIPTVREDGRLMEEEEAVQHFYSTGQHLGVFADPDSATRYAKSLSARQGRVYGGRP